MSTIRRFALRGPVLILIGGFFLAFLGAVGTVLATWSSREVALREWENRMRSVSRMLSAHASQSIGAADLVLRSISENVNDYRVRDDEEMRRVFSSHYVYDLLRESARGLPQIDVITIAARDGTLINFTRDYPPPPINLLDRDYFQAHLADPSLDVYLSKPVKNRGNGGWTFYLARKIRSPSGDMLGLVLTGLHSNFFSNFYESIGHGLTRVSLLRDDGALLARSSQSVAAPDGAPESARIIDQMKIAKHGSLLIRDETQRRTGFSEMAAFDVGEGLPIAISIAASRQQLLREWEAEAVKFVIEGGAMTGILIAATMILSRLISQLEAARNEALSAVEAKTRFASNVSHELRTPMNAIIGGAHQLMQTELAPESQKFAGIVSSAAQQLMVLINDILDFSYYEARNFRIEPAPFDVREMALNVIGMARSLVPDSQLEVTCTIADDTPCMALGDAGRICQVLLNLLSNGIKYTDRGAVRLAVSHRDGSLKLAVSDTGRGISAEDRQRIFQPFELGLSAGKRPGTGLGLTISKKLIEAMSGVIEVESAPGWGSQFTVTLPAPAVEPSREAPSQTLHEGPSPARSLDILIAEDVAPSRMLLQVMLEKMGHRVVAVENGLEAVAKAKEMRFDLVLMDLQMPELDGLAATRRIRALDGAKGQVRIIAVSANADLDGPAGLAEAGFNDTLLKPVTPARLEFMMADIAAAA